MTELEPEIIHEVYTVCVVYSWSKYREEIKKLLTDNYLIMNQETIKDSTNEELKIGLLKFHIDDELRLGDTTVGLTGVYENKYKTIFIKIVKIDNDITILIYKGDEKDFYIELIKHCRNSGCLILKIVNDEVIFKNRINIELIKCLNDVDKEKSIKIKNFNERFKMFESGTFSDDFKNKWIKLLES